jgi:hypothetical protein
MTSIPFSADEVHKFTPPSLENLVPAPTFRFRAVTERDKRRYTHELANAGLRMYPKEQMRAEILDTLQKNWSEETFVKESSRLLNFWAKLDQELDLDPDEQKAVTELCIRCMDVSPLLRRMDADTRRFTDEAPSVALSMYLGGWSGVQTPFRLEAGLVPLDTLNQLRIDIGKLEEQAEADKVDGVTVGLAYMELTIHAFHLLNLDEEDEKNSSAPSPSSDTLNGTKTSSRKAGKSRAGARRTTSRRSKTPETSSQTSIASS